MAENLVYAVILAGGQGTRLWPLSRKARPKQFLDLTGSDHSLLQGTVRRAIRLTGSINQVLVLTQVEHVGMVHEQLPDLPPENLLVEPIGRNTAPSLGLAAMHLDQTINVRQGSKPVMVTLPVDHLFVDEEPWFKAVRTSIETAMRTDDLVAIGLTPDRPSSAYGYQLMGDPVKLDLELPVHRLLKFVEKPAESLARTFVESGRYLWNTGTYAWKVSAFISAMEAHAPDLYAGLQSLGNPIDASKLERLYPSFTNISVDHAIMEKVDNAVTVQADFKRIDVGSLNSLAEIWPPDENANTALGNVSFTGSRENIVYTEDGLVVLLGVDDLVVVRAGEIVLVCPKDRTQDIKNLVAELARQNMEKYL